MRLVHEKIKEAQLPIEYCSDSGQRHRAISPLNPLFESRCLSFLENVVTWRASGFFYCFSSSPPPPSTTAAVTTLSFSRRELNTQRREVNVGVLQYRVVSWCTGFRKPDGRRASLSIRRVIACLQELRATACEAVRTLRGKSVSV